jgi:phospholipase C
LYAGPSDGCQPGVPPILDYLKAVKRPSRCDPGHYYLVNNYGPAYGADGTPVDVKRQPYTLPPHTLPNIAEALSKAG